MKEKRYAVIVGIDVSKNWLDISMSGQVTRVNQTKQAITHWIKKNNLLVHSTLVVMESTGGYERLAMNSFNDMGITVHVAHPNRIRAYAIARGCLAKTDKLDAKIIEGYGHFLDPSCIHKVLTKQEQRLIAWSRHLSQLKDAHHGESCRLGLVEDPTIKRSLLKIIRTIKKEIESIEQKLMNAIQSDPVLQKKYNLLCSMPGVGPALATILLTELPELGHATKKEIAALVGVAPLTRNSGLRTGKALTHYGRQSVRKILYMGALVASRHNKRLKSFYQRLLAKGKAKKVALVAVMRKMIVMLNAMLQKNTAFNA
jgi:transposase